MQINLDFLFESTETDKEQEIVSNNQWLNFFQTTPLSFILIAVNIAVYIIVVVLEGHEGLWKFGSLNQSLITLNQEYYRFSTANFLHGHPAHITINMFGLFVMGPFIEAIYGKANFFVLYMITGIAATISSYFITIAPNSVGASGSLAGIFGGLSIFILINKSRLKDKARKRLLIDIFVIIAINLVLSIFVPMFWHSVRIDHAGHLGGFVCGIVLGLLLTPKIFNDKPQSKFILYLAYFLGVIVIISFIWNIWFYITEFRFLNHMGEFF